MSGTTPSAVLLTPLPAEAWGEEVQRALSPMLPAFLRRYPELRLEVLATDAVSNLVEDRIDVAVRLGAMNASSLIARKLAPHRRAVCASPAYLAEHDAPRTPAIRVSPPTRSQTPAGESMMMSSAATLAAASNSSCVVTTMLMPSPPR